MRTTGFVCALGNAEDRLRKAIEDFICQLDSEQWTNAGIMIGRIEEIGNHVAAMARLATEALREDESTQRGGGGAS